MNNVQVPSQTVWDIKWFPASDEAKLRCDGCWKWKLLKKLYQHEPTGEVRCKRCYVELVS